MPQQSTANPSSSDPHLNDTLREIRFRMRELKKRFGIHTVDQLTEFLNARREQVPTHYLTKSEAIALQKELINTFCIRSPAENYVSLSFDGDRSRYDFLHRAYRVLSVVDPLALGKFPRISSLRADPDCGEWQSRYQRQPYVKAYVGAGRPSSEHKGFEKLHIFTKLDAASALVGYHLLTLKH